MSRRVLGEISGNRGKNEELSKGLRGEICGAYRSGDSVAIIAQRYNITSSSIQYTLDLVNQYINHQSLLRSGRSKKTNTRDERIIMKYVRLQPGNRWSQIK